MDTRDNSKKREFYNRPWFWIIIGVVVVVALSSLGNSGSNGQSAPSAVSEAPTTPSASTSASHAVSQPSKQVHTTPTGATVNANNASPATPPSPGTWHTVYTYSNNTDIQTPPFAMQGSQWRITYSCSIANSSIPYSSFNGVIDTVKGGGLNGSGDGHVFADNVTCPTSNTSYVYSLDFGGSLTPGQYYLNAGGYNSSYSVTVEEYY